MTKDSLKYEIVTITPTIAKKWLDENNFDNRRLDRYRVAKIAHDIKNDKWIFDGSPIRFNGGGNILDGQHRLSAIIRADKPVQSMVFRGLEQGTKNTIDTGKSRSISDILHFNGYINTTSLAAAARLSIGYREFKGDLTAWDKSDLSSSASPQEILMEINKRALLIKATQAILPLKYTKKMLGAGSPIFCYYLFATSSSQSLADNFFQKFENGDDLSSSSPILKLRNAFALRDQKKIGNGRRDSVRKVAMFIKAWNAWRSRKSLDSPDWVPTDEFPKIEK